MRTEDQSFTFSRKGISLGRVISPRQGGCAPALLVGRIERVPPSRCGLHSRGQRWATLGSGSVVSTISPSAVVAVSASSEGWQTMAEDNGCDVQ